MYIFYHFNKNNIAANAFLYLFIFIIMDDRSAPTNFNIINIIKNNITFLTAVKLFNNFKNSLYKIY